MKTDGSDLIIPVQATEYAPGHSAALTKREYFAAMAMQGMCADMDNANLQNSARSVASESVRFADTLIAELNKEKKNVE